MAAVAIVPAAGKGERFGGAKLAARLGSETVLDRTLQSLFWAPIDEVIVVTAPGGGLAVLTAMGDPRVRRIENPAPSLGMFSSIQRGIEVADGDPLLVLPADMPFIRSSTVKTVAAECARTMQIVMPSYSGKRGHPIAFPASLRAVLLAAPPESTLKQALAATGVAHVEIAVDDPGVLRDVDVPSDL